MSNNNHIYVVAGGLCVASLAGGAVGGYFYAKRKLMLQYDEELERQLEAATRYNERVLQDIIARNSPKYKAGSDWDQRDDDGVLIRQKYEPEDVYLQRVAEDEQRPDDDEPTDEEIQQVEEIARAGKQALIDYQGISTGKIVSEDEKPPPSALVRQNIFADKPKQPPRGPDGKFLPKQNVLEKTPYIISQEQFLENEPDHEQESLLYFINDKTLLDYSHETIEIDRVGEVNLTLFPDVMDGEISMICVRNEALMTDYDISLTYDSLTEHMGLGESDDDDYPNAEDEETADDPADH